MTKILIINLDEEENGSLVAELPLEYVFIQPFLKDKEALYKANFAAITRGNQVYVIKDRFGGLIGLHQRYATIDTLMHYLEERSSSFVDWKWNSYYLEEPYKYEEKD